MSAVSDVSYSVQVPHKVVNKYEKITIKSKMAITTQRKGTKTTVAFVLFSFPFLNFERVHKTCTNVYLMHLINKQLLIVRKLKEFHFHKLRCCIGFL
jgi:hypothetical protein